MLQIALFAPLSTSLLLLLLSRILCRRTVSLIACLSVLVSFLSFAHYLPEAMGHSFSQDVLLFSWIPVRGIDADFSLHLDHLSLVMGLIITGVGFLIHVYSIGYMEHDEDIARYFSFMNFFIFSMLLLILASHILVVFIGWEGVGLASYLLIGFWYQRPSAAKAATKALVVNRIGDIGFLLAIFFTYALFETGSIKEFSEKAALLEKGAPVLFPIAALYFWACTAKSAQFPLHVWLPDAMEGPTPVSALIHAATMVTAGVYLVIRLHPFFVLSPFLLESIGYIGGFTALIASLAATCQHDIKRVLAYSTIAQLGMMFLACAIGAFSAALFHLTIHAFVKALLFLAAGNVIHMTHGTTDMRKLGGLARALPTTSWLFLIGALAMAGLPPFAAFFSKDLILEEESIHGYHAFYLMGLAITFLTAFYMTRAYSLTFLGTRHLTQEEIDEAPKKMQIPTILLALCSIFGGLLGFHLWKNPPLMEFLGLDGLFLSSPDLVAGCHLGITAMLSTTITLLGVLSAWWAVSKKPYKEGSSLLSSGFYLDALYNGLFVAPLSATSNLCATVLERVILFLTVQLPACSMTLCSQLFHKMQSGHIRSYLSWIAIGASFFLFSSIL